MSSQLDEAVMNVAEVTDAASFETFRRQICRNLKTYETFTARVASYREEPSQLAAKSQDAALALGICEAALGRSQAVVAALEKARPCGLKSFLLGRALHDLGRHNEALDSYDRAATADWPAWHCELSKAETLLAARRMDEARLLLERHAAGKPGAGLWHYLQGWYLSLVGEVEPAIELLEQAVEQAPQNQQALFRLAYILDMQGEEEEAVALYQRCTQIPPVHVNALINLAVMHEDQQDYDAAEDFLMQVLETHPNHYRAREFLRDVRSSQTMYYDEDQERVRGKHSALLDVPVSDFELSVRSRNCLKRMDINTLGDLLRFSETDLLEHKNFGETSLNEIRAMLAQKGLRLGQVVDTADLAAATPPARVSSHTAGISQAVLNKPVAELELSVRSRKCLQRLNIVTLADLAARTEDELLGIKNFGQTSLSEIKQRLAENGLSLRKLEEN